MAKLRQFIEESKGKGDIYGSAVNGSFPLVIHVENEYDIMQLTKIKHETPALDLVILGGGGAHLVSRSLTYLFTNGILICDTFRLQMILRQQTSRSF